MSDLVRKTFKAVIKEPSNRLKIEVLVNYLKRRCGITNEDIAVYQVDSLPKDLVKPSEMNDLSIIKLSNHVIDISNVDSVNARKILPMICLYQLFDETLPELLEDNSYRLGLPEVLLEISECFKDKTIEYLAELDIKDALLKASENIFQVILEDFSSAQSLVKHQIGKKHDEYQDILFQYKQIIDEDPATIVVQEEYNKYQDSTIYMENIDLLDDCLKILKNDNQEVIDDDCFYCRSCGDELTFLNEVTAYCESCDKTMLVRSLVDGDIDLGQEEEPLEEEY